MLWQWSMSAVRLSRNEVRTQKDRVVLRYTEWLQFLLIRSKSSIASVFCLTFYNSLLFSSASVENNWREVIAKGRMYK